MTTATACTESLAADLRRLGVRPGGALLVHASLRAVGPVAGGARAVVEALRTALGGAGTLVVPSFTPENSDTSRAHLARLAALPESGHAALLAAMPPFGPSTPAPGMGRLAETVRLTPGAVRSAHPQTSFTALGPAATRLTCRHHEDCHLGEDSPLARLYEEDGRALLLGTGFGSFSAFHLAEYRVPDPPRRTYRCVVIRDGRRTWWSYEDVALDDDDFAALGADFLRTAAPGAVRGGRVGAAVSRLVPVREAVDFALDRFKNGRPAAG
ncbi:aminoglycoside N(3)-acetyltransferase [uncultured Streptomyces sp.]|uniref:aminoglycoside N(3)-acetyltransferase n=1 Tax=uncultured Streptomyces sp. TaxID=174707 RepID=UPI002627AA04|nr:AAC(3) family N-acetyltransferase [uncultured Streptomyces sp.]